jgi:small subunit ribosomal protein S9
VTTPDATNPEHSTDAEEAQDVSTPDQEAPEALTADVSFGTEPVEAEPVAAEKPVITRTLSDKPVQTVGRRKEAVVRVRLVPGNGKFQLNGKDLPTYFPNKLHQQLIKDPFLTVEKVDGYDVFARLHGGGISGQAGALRLAIARALIEVNPDDRPALKAAGFLTRDSRATERKKYGLKKARKAPQYSKR